MHACAVVVVRLECTNGLGPLVCVSLFHSSASVCTQAAVHADSSIEKWHLPGFVRILPLLDSRVDRSLPRYELKASLCSDLHFIKDRQIDRWFKMRYPLCWSDMQGFDVGYQSGQNDAALGQSIS